jgi:ADP-ribose pyrophosphatase YjhB (NUDIX family)
MTYIVRNAARAIILTPERYVLLMRMAFPWREEDVWILPGGGIEDGEHVYATVSREILEETGAKDIEIIGEAWRGESKVEATSTHLKQRYFLVYAARFEPEPTDLSEQEMDWLRECRWWSVDSLATANIMVEPERIACGLRALISNGLPPTPIEIDEL